MKILVSANNPGGADSLLPVVKKLVDKGEELTIILEGKAKGVFAKGGVNFLDAERLNDVKLKSIVSDNNFDIFLAGTSLGFTVDKKLLQYCQEYKIISVYILDFWSNYWQRFSAETKDFKFLPDYICVMDELTKKEMVSENFPEKKIIITGNPRFDHFLDNIDNSREDKDRILFISQPLKECKNYTDAQSSHDEYVVLKDVMQTLNSIKSSANLVIRLHPRDVKGKYDVIMSKSKRAVVYDSVSDVAESLSRSGLVIGISSVVLFQAALAGKKVISYQPNLEGRDALISNRLGISKLVANKEELKICLENYLNESAGPSWHINRQSSKDIIIPGAADNVMKFIDSVKK